jgi:hypothetical protein
MNQLGEIAKEIKGRMIGRMQREIDRLRVENARFKAGLQIIIEAGAAHGAGWCIAQARGHLEDLDFDQWPETGKPPMANPKSTFCKTEK